ncbi:MAG: hypothetical protein AABX91_01815 [Nanoarchaeota archaeon]
MLNKKETITGLFFLVFLISFLYSIPQVSAVGETFVCAEKTLSGAWCMNVPENQASTAINPATGRAYSVARSSCESTSFCRMGTCVDNQQGECRPNVPQRVCQASSGFWVQGKPEAIPQCQLGCCLVGDQAAFVTATGCTAIGSQYGVTPTFNSQVRDSESCLALSNPKAMGACVIDDGFQRDCKNIANAECNALQTSGSGNRKITFSEGLLCTADVLATRCAVPAPNKIKTTCVEGKFGVYFLDTCGNIANIYDASKVDVSKVINREYWTYRKDISESCGATSNNAGSKTCGNCDYQAGSICKPVNRATPDATPQPSSGDFVCADLSCTYKNEKYLHGESWCAGNSPGANENLPGSEHYVLTCYSGEVTSSQCDSLRQSICHEDTIEGYSVAACVANNWRDCVDQKNKTVCEDAQKRDCKWVVGSALQIPGLSDNETGVTYVLDDDGNLVPRAGSTGTVGAACVPRYAPGLNTNTTEAEIACFAASETCLVKFGRQNRLDDWSCKSNCQCLKKEWADGKINQCLALGDCGVKKNYLGQKGESYDPFTQEGEHVTGFSQNPVNERKFP